jgi:cytochrome c553
MRGLPRRRGQGAAARISAAGRQPVHHDVVARTAPTTYDESLPALVRVGDPLRNIAPCISCHGGVDQKLGAPWLEGMPKEYLVDQLVAFKNNTRRNDPHAQMRNMAVPMTAAEIDQVATFYARKAGTTEAR